MVMFTKHAEEKFAVLQRHHCCITRAQVLRAIDCPDRIDHSRAPLLIAQIGIDDRHVLRVVYKLRGSEKVIITFYPGRKNQYEN